MKQTIKTLKILALVAVFGSMLLTAPASAATSIDSSKEAVCKGAGLTGANCGDKGAAIDGVISGILTLLSAVVGIAAVVMVIIAGMRYITSGGDTNKVASAKSALLYAIIGLIVVALAQILVHFVFAKATAPVPPVTT